MKTKTANKKSISGANAKKLYFWIEFHKNAEKKWLNLYVPFDAGDTEEELANHICSNQYIFGLQSDLEPQCYGAYNWEIVKIEEVVHDFSTRTQFDYDIAQSPKEIKKEKAIKKFEGAVDKYTVTDKDIEFDEKTTELVINNLPHGSLKLPIDKIYDLIEKEINCDIDLINYKGETILTLMNGSFLDAGFADIKVFASRKDADEYSLFNQKQKGGIFIRENGVIDIGNIERTKFLSINLANLIRELNHKGILSGVITGKIDFRDQFKIEAPKNEKE